jgi:hypothetical protein
VATRWRRTSPILRTCFKEKPNGFGNVPTGFLSGIAYGNAPQKPGNIGAPVLSGIFENHDIPHGLFL